MKAVSRIAGPASIDTATGVPTTSVTVGSECVSHSPVPRPVRIRQAEITAIFNGRGNGARGRFSHSPKDRSRSIASGVTAGCPTSDRVTGSGLGSSLRIEHELAVWRRCLPLPGFRHGLKGQDLELHLDLSGGGVVRELAVSCRLLLPGDEEARVPKNR